MIISNESIEAIEYIMKIYSCYKTTDDVIRAMLRDFARNTDNDVLFDILKKNTSKRLAMIDADRFTKLNLMLNELSDSIDDLNKKLTKR